MSYSSGSLLGLGVLERDVNDEVVSWWFPAFDAALDSTLRYRVGLLDPQQGAGGSGGSTSAGSTPPLSPSNSSLSSFTPFFSSSTASSPPPSFRYSRASSSAGGVWHYSLTLSVESTTVAALSPVRVASIVLLSSSYDVLKARHLLHQLAKVPPLHFQHSPPSLQPPPLPAVSDPLSSIRVCSGPAVPGLWQPRHPPARYPLSSSLRTLSRCPVDGHHSHPALSTPCACAAVSVPQDGDQRPRGGSRGAARGAEEGSCGSRSRSTHRHMAQEEEEQEEWPCSTTSATLLTSAVLSAPRAVLNAAVVRAALIRQLGVEVILVWVAVLCKRRLLLCGGDVDSVQEAVRSAALLGASHRQSFDFLRPLTTLRDDEVGDLRQSGHYIAGCVDPQAMHRRDLYDLAVDRQTHCASASATVDYPSPAPL